VVKKSRGRSRRKRKSEVRVGCDEESQNSGDSSSVFGKTELLFGEQVRNVSTMRSRPVPFLDADLERARPWCCCTVPRVFPLDRRFRAGAG